jgi:hypothetical protein
LKLKKKTDLIKPDYYEITNWNHYTKTETECKQLCLNDQNCLFVIHFYRDQYNSSDINTSNRKPLINAAMNTCILRNELKIQYGTQRDSSSKIHYLSSIFVFFQLIWCLLK